MLCFQRERQPKRGRHDQPRLKSRIMIRIFAPESALEISRGGGVNPVV
jgi:hypothetical protein